MASTSLGSGPTCTLQTIAASAHTHTHTHPKAPLAGQSPLTVRHELSCWLQQPEARPNMHTPGHRLAVWSQQLLLAAGQHKARRNRLQVGTQHGAVCSNQAAEQQMTSTTHAQQQQQHQQDTRQPVSLGHMTLGVRRETI